MFFFILDELIRWRHGLLCQLRNVQASSNYTAILITIDASTAQLLLYLILIVIVSTLNTS